MRVSRRTAAGPAHRRAGLPRCCCSLCRSGSSSTGRSTRAWARCGTRSRRRTARSRAQAHAADGRGRGAAEHRRSACSPRWCSCAAGSAARRCSTRSSTCRSRSRPSWSGWRCSCSTAATGWFGAWLLDHGIQVIFSIPGMILATIFVSLPFVVREVIPVLREIGTGQEQAAATLGASRLADVLAHHAAGDPLGRAYGVVLTTARALGEFGAVSVVSGKILGPDARRCRSTSRTGSRTSTSPAPTRRPRCSR